LGDRQLIAPGSADGFFDGIKYRGASSTTPKEEL